jgi:hypothetical protein
MMVSAILGGVAGSHMYDNQVTKRKLRGLPVRASLLLAALLLAALESYMTPSRLEYTKRPSQTGGSSYFLIEKSPKTAFC